MNIPSLFFLGTLLFSYLPTSTYAMSSCSSKEGCSYKEQATQEKKVVLKKGKVKEPPCTRKGAAKKAVDSEEKTWKEGRFRWKRERADGS